MSAQIRAQGSVIEGLRSERKLWSEELAQQGMKTSTEKRKRIARPGFLRVGF